MTTADNRLTADMSLQRAQPTNQVSFIYFYLRRISCCSGYLGTKIGDMEIVLLESWFLECQLNIYCL